MKTIIQGIAILFLIIVTILLSISVVSAVAIGSGWILTRIITDFTLFEATVVIILTTTITITLLNTIAKLIMDTNESPESAYPINQFTSIDANKNNIPVTRFSDSLDEYDGEAYFRYHVANAIFENLSKLPRTIGLTNEQQIRELAIRLTIPAVNILKRRRKRARKITLSAVAMEKEMERMGLKPYDDDILETAVITINESLKENEELRTIINEHEWDELQWF